MINQIYYYDPINIKPNSIIFIDSQISAGFPDSMECQSTQTYDIHDFLIKHPFATFFVKIKGNSMIDENISDGDILIIDRALPITNNKLVLVRINDEFTIKRVVIDRDRIFFIPGIKKNYAAEIKENGNVEIAGVVSFIIHKTIDN